MIYDNVIIDAANLFYRVKDCSKQSIEILKKMIASTDEALSHLDINGTSYILFDDVHESDLDCHKSFNYQTWRKKILPDYKLDRYRSDRYLSCMTQYKKYYTYRGSKIKLLYSEEYEADDFVQPLLKNLNGSAALVTNDYDWSGFISDKVHLINNYWDAPMDRNEFISKFKFNPTYSSVILYKSFFGDKSDNITGAIFIKKAKFNVPIKELVLKLLVDVGNHETSVDDIICQLKNFRIENRKECLSDFGELSTALKTVNYKVPVIDTFLKNVSCVRSGLENKDISSFIHYNKDRPETNKLLYSSIFGVPFGSTFGKV